MTESSPVVVIMPKGEIARFPEKVIAKAMLLKRYHDNIFESPEDIYLRVSHDVCLTMIEKIRSQSKELLASDQVDEPATIRTQHREAANYLWSLMYQYADEVFQYNKKGKVIQIHQKDLNPDEGDFKLRTYWLLYEPGVDPLMDAAFISLPPQARQCLQVLIDTIGMEIVSEATAFKHIMRDKKGTIKTRQSKWRIFKYYRSMLIVRNFMRMRG